MDTEIYFEQIEKYSTGAMSADERADFEKELTTNEALKKVFRLYQLSGEVLETGVEDDLRKTLKGWSEAGQSGQHQAGGAKVISFQRRLFMYAAAASVLLLVGFFSWNFVRQNYADTALAEAYHEIPQASAFRGNGATEVLDFENGLSAFEKGEYQKAISILQSVPSDNSRYYEALLFIGNSHFQLRNYAEASTVFQQIIDSGDIRFLEKAEWAFLLSKLAASGSDAPEVQNLLDKILADEGHAFHSDAGELKTKLDSFWKKLVR